MWFTNLSILFVIDISHSFPIVQFGFVNVTRLISGIQQIKELSWLLSLALYGGCLAKHWHILTFQIRLFFFFLHPNNFIHTTKEKEKHRLSYL